MIRDRLIVNPAPAACWLFSAAMASGPLLHPDVVHTLSVKKVARFLDALAQCDRSPRYWLPRQAEKRLRFAPVPCLAAVSGRGAALNISRSTFLSDKTITFEG
jgi:hypothetical protein